MYQMTLGHLRDKKDFWMITTFDNFSLENAQQDETPRRGVIRNYNSFAKGADRMNQLCGYYRFGHKTRKWWKLIFYRFLQIVMVNSYILYKHSNPNAKLKLKHFQSQAATELYCKNFSQVKKVGRKLLIVHNQVHIQGIWAKDCKCCRTSKSSFKCVECSDKYGREITLCRENCFATFHLDPEKYLAQKKK